MYFHNVMLLHDESIQLPVYKQLAQNC